MPEKFYPLFREVSQKRETLRMNSFAELLDFAYEKLSIEKDYLTTFIKQKGYDVDSKKLSWKFSISGEGVLRITPIVKGIPDRTFGVQGEKARVLDKETRTMKEIYIPVAYKRPDKDKKIPIRYKGSRGFGPDSFEAGPGKHPADK